MKDLIFINLLVRQFSLGRERKGGKGVHHVISFEITMNDPSFQFTPLIIL